MPPLRPRSLLTALLLLGCGCRAGGEADVPPGSPVSAPADTGLVPLLEEVRRESGIPALAAVVVRSDTVLDVAAAGLRRLGAPDPVRVGDRFHVGSNTKAITATLLAVLVEEGRLAWTTRPADVLPELRGSIHPAYRDVTLEQLLAHRAGVPAYTSGFALAFLPDSLYAQGGRTSAAWRRAFVLHVLGEEPKVPPGTRFLYSNAGYTVAAAMAEAVTGESWEALLQARVLRPLGMPGGYGWPGAADPAQPWGHWRKLFRGVRPHDPNGEYQLGALLAPAGDVHLSIGGYARFLQEHLRGLRGGDGLLRAATVQRLHTPTGDYALGWIVQPFAGARASAHEGSAGTFHAIAVVLAERDLAVAVFANAGFARAGDADRALARVLLDRYTERISRN
jgi:D-alanyl-D-alanine carboxypeptidase